MITDLQKRTAQAIINIFETGSAQGDYANVTLAAGDAGHLTYGRSQTTLASGNLFLLIRAYCQAASAQFASALNPYLPQLAACDTALDTDMAFRALLREAGDDAEMHDVQDQFFDRVYWAPSVQAAAATGISTALGTNVVYDGKIQGAWGTLRNITNQTDGLLGNIGEQNWITAYIKERRAWLANNANALLHKTVYRMDAFSQLIGQSAWDLPLPLTVRGILIDESVLTGGPPSRASAPDPGERLLKLESPPLQGGDVTSLQQALVSAGIAMKVDGVFGPRTDAAVRWYQSQNDLMVDGIVGPATRAALGLS